MTAYEKELVVFTLNLINSVLFFVDFRSSFMGGQPPNVRDDATQDIVIPLLQPSLDCSGRRDNKAGNSHYMYML